MLGADVKGKRVLHVSDLNNEGSSPRDMWVPSIRNAGGIIENYLSYVDRLEKGVKVLQELGIKSYPAVPLDDFAWDLLLKWEKIEEDVYKNIRERMENPDAWAVKMLQSDKGLETLAKLYNRDRRNRDDAERAMRYYSESVDFAPFLRKVLEKKEFI